MAANLKVLKTVVHGATGRQGGSGVRALAAAGHSVRAIVRDTAAPKAVALAALPHIELALVEDMLQPGALAAAYAGADLVFGMTSPSEHEVVQGKAMVDAAKAAHIGLFVWSSLENVSAVTGDELHIPNFDRKAQVADYLRTSGVPYVELFLGGFFENYLTWPGGCTLTPAGEIEIIYNGFPADFAIHSLYIRKDLGNALAIIAAHVSAFKNKEIVLAPTRLSPHEHAAIVQRMTGRITRAVHAEAQVQMRRDVVTFIADPRFGWYQGRTLPDPLLKEHGFVASSFEDFVREEMLPFLKL